MWYLYAIHWSVYVMPLQVNHTSLGVCIILINVVLLFLLFSVFGNHFCLICSGSQGSGQTDLLGCCGTSGIVCGVLTLAMSVCACVCTLLYGSLLIIKLAYLTLVIIGLHFAVFALDVCILWPWLYGPLIVVGLRSLHILFFCIWRSFVCSEMSKRLSKCLLRMRKMPKIKPISNFLMTDENIGASV